MKLPREIDDAKRLGSVLLSYTGRYYGQVIIGYLVTYILLAHRLPVSSSSSVLSDCRYYRTVGNLRSTRKDISTRILTLLPSPYISLQSFAIPGSIFLSILAGYLFSFPLALFLVCLVIVYNRRLPVICLLSIAFITFMQNTV